MRVTPVLEELMDFVIDYSNRGLSDYDIAANLLAVHESFKEESYERVVTVMQIGVTALKNMKEYKDRRRLKMEKTKPDLGDFAKATKVKDSYEKSIVRQERRVQSRDLQAKYENKKLLEEWLINHVPLGDLTKLQLLNAINYHTKVAEGHMRNVAFYNAIVSKLPHDRAKVRDHVTEGQLRAMRDAIYQPDEAAVGS